MTDINKLEELAKAALQAAPGEWARDWQDSEGAYGSGPDARHGFMVPVLYANGKQVLTGDGSEVALVCEEYGADGAIAWDDATESVVDYVAAANPESLLQFISQYRRMEEALRKIASCTSYAPGDMPDIARQALQSTEQQG